MQKQISYGDKLSLLPETARSIAGLIGIDATRQLINAFGGITLPITQGKTKAGKIRFSALSEVIGEGNARKLANHYQSERIYIPRCDAWIRHNRNINIVSDFDRLTIKDGYSSPDAVIELSMKYRLSDRQIEEIIKNTIA